MKKILTALTLLSILLLVGCRQPTVIRTSEGCDFDKLSNSTILEEGHPDNLCAVGVYAVEATCCLYRGKESGCPDGFRLSEDGTRCHLDKGFE